MEIVMTNSRVCPFCEEEAARVVEYSGKIKFGRKSVFVSDLKKVVCDHCGSESVPLEFHDKNAELIRDAASISGEVISVDVLKAFREKWGLSQKDASLIFGAGVSSFGKWESRQSNISTPAALLIQVAAKFPEVVSFLAKMADVDLCPRSSATKESVSASSHKLYGAYETVSSKHEDAANGIYIHVPNSRDKYASFPKKALSASWEMANLEHIGAVRIDTGVNRGAA